MSKLGMEELTNVNVNSSKMEVGDSFSFINTDMLQLVQRPLKLFKLWLAIQHMCQQRILLQFQIHEIQLQLLFVISSRIEKEIPKSPYFQPRSPLQATLPPPSNQCNTTTHCNLNALSAYTLLHFCCSLWYHYNHCSHNIQNWSSLSYRVPLPQRCSTVSLLVTF